MNLTNQQIDALERKIISELNSEMASKLKEMVAAKKTEMLNKIEADLKAVETVLKTDTSDLAVRYQVESFPGKWYNHVNQLTNHDILDEIDFEQLILKGKQDQVRDEILIQSANDLMNIDILIESVKNKFRPNKV